MPLESMGFFVVKNIVAESEELVQVYKLEYVSQNNNKLEVTYD